MNRALFPVILVLVLVGLTGWAVYWKITGNTEPLESVFPSPTLSTEPNASSSATPTPGPVIELEGGVQAQDLLVGDGEVATTESIATVHYVGFLTDGTIFDTSVEREPFQFRIGAGQVIPGWEIGVVGMRIGGIRQLVIPPEMGYGAQSIGSIPPNSTLVFQIQLLGVGN